MLHSYCIFDYFLGGLVIPWAGRGVFVGANSVFDLTRRIVGDAYNLKSLSYSEFLSEVDAGMVSFYIGYRNESDEVLYVTFDLARRF